MYIRSLIISLMIGLTGISSSYAYDFTVQANNKLEYYLDRETDAFGVRQDSLRNRLVVDLVYGGFYGGIWYEAYDPLAKDTTYQGISQRYFGWSDGSSEIRVGNFYANFYKGMLLRAYESEDLQVDKNIDGIWGAFCGDLFNFQLLSGKILLENKNPLENPWSSPLVHQRDNTISGAQAEFTPIRNFRFGAAAVRYESVNPFTADIDYTDGWEITAGANYGPFDIYADYARQKGTPGFALARPQLETGDGTYLSASISTGLIGVAAEYKNYYNLFLDFNSPPVANHRNQSPNAISGGGSGADDKGFQLSFFLSPFENWTFEADVAQGEERPDPVTGHSRDKLYNNFYEVRGYIGRHSVIFNYERTDMGFEGLEQLPYGEVTFYIDDENTVTLTGQVLKYEREPTARGRPDYHETDYSISFSHSYFLTLTVFGGFANKQPLAIEEPFPERSGAVSVNVRYGEHDVNLFYGDQRGGFVCTEGACRVVPPFRGMKLTIISRF